MPKPRIDEHPDYPFREGREEQLGNQSRRFLGAPEVGTPVDALLREFVVLVQRYAFLEKLIQGEILYQLPIHTHLLGPDAESDPEEQGELMAEDERGPLNWKPGDADALTDALDEMGIKLFFRESDASTGPSDAGAGPDTEAGAGVLFGAFHFEGESGPSILVGTTPDRPEAAFIAAHEFAHFIADIDPYVPRFCAWDPKSLENLLQTPAEIRADRFARALLLPVDAMTEVLSKLERVNAPGAEDPRWGQLMTLFEVPASLLARRMEDLGFPGFGRRPAGGVASAFAPSDDSRPLPGPQVQLALPERFVNLALAAYAARILEPDSLALFLRTSEDEARRVLAWAGISRQEPDPDPE